MREFALEKMKTEFRDDQDVLYFLGSAGEYFSLNQYLGQDIKLHYQDSINCVSCGRKTKKSFNQGHCYPCFKSLASCDMCVVKPELCHYSKGTCREPQWGEDNCLIPHTIYLSNSSGLKVGITRGTQPITRWIDQGASSAIAIGTVKNRLDAGKIEVALKDNFADKTNWRKMLSSDGADVDLKAEREKAISLLKDNPLFTPADSEPVSIKYPILEYPEKIKSHNLDKNPEVSGTLLGIKGQYLILSTGVINIRKFGG